LLEILVATAIFVVLVGALYSLLHGALRLRETAHEVTEAGLPNDYIALLIKRDLANVSAPVSLLAGPMIGEKDEQALQRALERFRAVEELIVERERKGRTQRFDLKQQVPLLDMDCRPHGVEITMRIGVRKGGFPKPEEVLRAVFSLDGEQMKGALITRTDVGFGSTSESAKGAGRGRYES